MSRTMEGLYSTDHQTDGDGLKGGSHPKGERSGTTFDTRGMVGGGGGGRVRRVSHFASRPLPESDSTTVVERGTGEPVFGLRRRHVYPSPLLLRDTEVRSLSPSRPFRPV